jgi:hypothetical protein
MTEAETILKMIETVDPYDTAKLDEIDALVWCYLKNVHFVEHGKNHLKFKSDKHLDHEEYYYSITRNSNIPQYTRSRDALKAIRPEKVSCTITTYPSMWHAQCTANYWLNGTKSFDEHYTFVSPDTLPTEELAELHAVIQAIAHERGVTDATAQ